MNLMRHNQLVVADAQHLTQRLTVFADVLFIVATIAVDVECGVVTLAAASVACAAKSDDTLGQFL